MKFNLKKIPLSLFLLCVCVGFSGACGKLDVITLRESSEAEIPGATLVESIAQDGLQFGGFEGLQFSQSQELQNQGVKENQIDSVKMDSLILTVTNPENGDMSFLTSLEFFIDADELPKVRIASFGDFQAGQNSISMLTDDQEMKDYIVADSMTITTSVEGQKPDQTTTIKGDMAIKVDIDVGGAIFGN